MADLSHWINVAETDTNDPDLTQVIEDLAHQTYHVHCRVGYDHGPQVFFDLFRARTSPNLIFCNLFTILEPPKYSNSNPPNLCIEFLMILKQKN